MLLFALLMLFPNGMSKVLTVFVTSRLSPSVAKGKGTSTVPSLGLRYLIFYWKSLTTNPRRPILSCSGTPTTLPIPPGPSAMPMNFNPSRRPYLTCRTWRILFDISIAVHKLRAFHCSGLTSPPDKPDEALLIRSARWMPHEARIRSQGTF